MRRTQPSSQAELQLLVLTLLLLLLSLRLLMLLCEFPSVYLHYCLIPQGEQTNQCLPSFVCMNGVLPTTINGTGTVGGNLRSCDAIERI